MTGRIGNPIHLEPDSKKHLSASRWLEPTFENMLATMTSRWNESK